MIKRIQLPVVILLLLLFQNGKAQEEKYIGLFVYNFTKFFDWPSETKTGDFVISILGHESVAKELKQLSAQKKIGTQSIVIQTLSNPAEVGKCQIMFVGFWHSRYLPEIVEKLKSESCLIITEKEGLLQQGAAINFLVRENAIKFEFDKSNAARHNLKIDPRITELAFKVEE